MSRRSLLLTVVALFVLLASARTAEACSCGGPGPPCESFSASFRHDPSAERAEPVTLNAASPVETVTVVIRKLK